MAREVRNHLASPVTQADHVVEAATGHCVKVLGALPRNVDAERVAQHPDSVAQTAGSGLLVSLALAAAVANCNATSSARFAARYPAAGGAYVNGWQRLGDFWGYLAGWGFVVGKIASCAAIALTVGLYVRPEHAHAVAVAAVAALTAVNYIGIEKSALLTRAIVAAVLGVLTAVVIATLGLGDMDVTQLDVGGDTSIGGLLQAAGLLFFAFAGYARIATGRGSS